LIENFQARQCHHATVDGILCTGWREQYRAGAFEERHRGSVRKLRADPVKMGLVKTFWGWGWLKHVATL